MMLTQKIRIYPSEEQAQLLWVFSEKCRLIFNFALAERVKNWKENQKKSKEEHTYITYNAQSKSLPLLKEQYPEYKWVYSKVLQTTLEKLRDDYKSFFSLWKKGDKKARPPRFKGKKYFTTLCYNQSGFKIKDSSITFSHFHPSKIQLHFTLPPHLIPQEKIKQVEISFSQKKWFASINYEFTPPNYSDNSLYQAFDLGITQTVGVNILGKGIHFSHRRADLYWKKKIEQVQSKQDHCKKYSKKWNWYHLKLCKMKRKCAFQLRDFQHWLSHQIITNTKANTIIVGKLNVKKMAQKKKGTGNAKKNKIQKTLNHSVQNTGFMSRFTQFLTYKAKKVGKRVIKIDESKTTQVCCNCGKGKKRALYERTIICDCGNHIDRDFNSAINIMVHFLDTKSNYDFLSHQSSVNEESFLNRWRGFLRQTDQPVLEAVVHS